MENKLLFLVAFRFVMGDENDDGEYNAIKTVLLFVG